MTSSTPPPGVRSQRAGPPMRRRLSSRSPPGTASLMRPMSAASLPLTGSPSISISFARRNPISRGMKATPPSPAAIPFLTWLSQQRASSAAMTKSRPSRPRSARDASPGRSGHQRDRRAWHRVAKGRWPAPWERSTRRRSGTAGASDRSSQEGTGVRSCVARSGGSDVTVRTARSWLTRNALRTLQYSVECGSTGELVGHDRVVSSERGSTPSPSDRSSI